MKTVLSVCAGALAAASACADVIDFSQTPPGIFDSYSEAGAIFTGLDGIGLTSDRFGDTPNGTRGLISDGPPNIQHDYVPIRVDFAALQSFVAVDIGDNNADADTVFLRAFDQNDQLLLEDTAFLDPDFSGMVRLEASAPGIAYAVFGGQGINGSSVYADNVEFVPAPGVGVCLVAGLAWGRRRG
jgi:hypothetical protein